MFIDGSNLYHGIKNFIGDGKTIPIDIRKFAEVFTGGNRRLVKILFYTAPVSQQEDKDGYAKQQRFLANIKQIHFLDLRLGRLAKREKKFECSHCARESTFITHVEKGVDVYIASDLLVHAFDDQYDTAILVSEDGDFVPAVQEAQRLSKKVENVYFRPSHLSQRCNGFRKITREDIEQCKLANRHI